MREKEQKDRGRGGERGGGGRFIEEGTGLSVAAIIGVDYMEQRELLV